MCIPSTAWLAAILLWVILSTLNGTVRVKNNPKIKPLLSCSTPTTKEDKRKRKKFLRHLARYINKGARQNVVFKEYY
jgi:hypothetical protein